MKATLAVSIQRKQFRSGLVALEDFSLTAAPGEFLAIVGPSGAGKTTLLRIIAGLDDAVEGSILLDGSPVTTGPDGTRIGFVFQEPRLMPWLTVRENVQLVAREGQPVDPGVDALINKVGLGEFADAFPAQLSGGMQRRVALARAFLNPPDLLLLDEAFQSLDEPTADELRTLLRSLWQQHRPTVLFVTHHTREALALANRVLFLSDRPANVVLDYRVPGDAQDGRDPTEVDGWYQDLLATHPGLLSGIIDP